MHFFGLREETGVPGENPRSMARTFKLREDKAEIGIEPRSLVVRGKHRASLINHHLSNSFAKVCTRVPSFSLGSSASNRWWRDFLTVLINGRFESGKKGNKLQVIRVSILQYYPRSVSALLDFWPIYNTPICRSKPIPDYFSIPLRSRSFPGIITVYFVNKTFFKVYWSH